MKGKILLLSGMSLALASNAQQLTNDYIQWPESSKLYEWVKKWTPGQQLFEDENFFISRVKIKPHFRNVATQIYPELTESNDKRLAFWVPVGYAQLQGVHTDALPNGRFDSEVFSMWPYVTHYGDWTSPHGWVPAGFADAAHKHGTLVSGVASIPWGSITDSWRTCLQNQVNLSNEHLAHFLWYHGVNGLGYNSEFNGGGSFINKLMTQHEEIVKYFNAKGTPIENIWYDGVSNGGSLSLTECLSSGSNDQIFGDADHVRTHLFINYNWNRSDRILSSQQTAAKLGRSMLDLYAGHNMQGPGSGSYANTCFLDLKTCDYSIGLWGAHATNMIWQNRNSNGASPEALQATYQKGIEQFFGNGNRNPANEQPIYETASWGPRDDWFGMSRYMTARSSLSWDLGDEPFVTFFNLGNGRFFNWKGERQNDKEWYNLGVQDYMPTWRFWFADKFLGNKPADVPAEGLDANFTWNDAWMGGSCLEVTGSTADEYLHLFKTQFTLSRNDVITVRYKLVGGSANVNLIISAEGAEETILRESSMSIVKNSDLADDEVWVEKQIKITGPNQTLNGKTIALIGFHFTDAKNLRMRLGEISICRGTYDAPNTPTVTLTKALANNYSGVDGKIIFSMPSNKSVDEPVYNLDVRTSLFRVYSQQQGKEPVNMGATSSWAAIAFCAPNDVKGDQKMRFGVSAVGLDFTTESEIAWGEWLDLPDYVTNEHIQLSKSVIKPGESFTVSFVDPAHAPADWALYNAEGTKMASATETTELTVNGLDNVGGYDLTVNEGKADARRLNNYVQVSSWSTGALPEIQSLAINGAENANGITIAPAEKVELSYTGRASDGEGSRGVELGEKLFGMPVNQLGINAYKSFSISAWIRVGDNPAGTYSFMTIENRNGNWPKNNWGFFWCRINQDGYIVNNLHDGAYGGSLDSNSEGMRLYADFSKSCITPNAWVHVTYVFDYNESNQLRYRFYLNGVPQEMQTWLHINKGTREGLCNGDWNDFTMTGSATAYGHNTTETGYASSSYPLSSNDWISFGGTCQNINAMNAVIDDVQIWGKAMTDADVKTAMNGLDPDNIPADVIAWWDLNDDVNADNGFVARGSKAGALAYKFEHAAGTKEGQAGNQPLAPDFSAGCPFLSAKSYKVVTKPEWTVRRAEVLASEGTDTQGKATVVFNREGDFTARLTLSNAHGSHSMDYPVISVGGSSAVEAVETEGNVEVYASAGTIFVAFAEAGDYTVNVYNLNGTMLATNGVSAAAGTASQVSIGQAGAYIVSVVRNGEVVRNVKVVVR